MKRTPMPPRKKPLARSALKAGGALLRRTPMKQRSKAKDAELRVRRGLREELIAERGYLCQARFVLPRVCAVIATDMHEVIRRSQGGSAVDPTNILLLCRQCHSWVTEHPAEATALGLSAPGWTRDKGDAA